MHGTAGYIVRHVGKIIACIIVTALAAGAAQGQTFRPMRPTDTRKIEVVRDYKIPAVKGQKLTAMLPAMMSFWGATNRQVILDSTFTYSLKPDEVKVIFNEDDKSRRYCLTWNSPDADAISVTEVLKVELASSTALFTSAKLPYAKEVLDAHANSLGADKEINPENEQVAVLAKEIQSHTKTAEAAVEMACDWVQENIPFKSKQPGQTDTVLKNKFGNCVGMANVVCSIVRKMGIPAQSVSANFIGGDSGHQFLEVYFPDAGWVFYDPSNGSRGFKSLDCIMEPGQSFWYSQGQEGKWESGYFAKSRDLVPYTEENRLQPPPIRKGPQGHPVSGAVVTAGAPPSGYLVRQQSLLDMIADISVPPGKREGPKPVAAIAARKQKPSPATKPAKVAKPAPDPAAQSATDPATTQLNLARVYLGNGMTAKAKEILEAIVRDHGSTPAAAEARAELQKLH